MPKRRVLDVKENDLIFSASIAQVVVGVLVGSDSSLDEKSIRNYIDKRDLPYKMQDNQRVFSLRDLMAWSNKTLDDLNKLKAEEYRLKNEKHEIDIKTKKRIWKSTESIKKLLESFASTFVMADKQERKIIEGISVKAAKAVDNYRIKNKYPKLQEVFEQ